MPKKEFKTKKTDIEHYDTAEKYFHCTDRERAAFEAGIKLGSLFHQFIGTPITLDNVSSLEETMTQSVMSQPFVNYVQIKIKRDALNKKLHHYDYLTLSGDMLVVNLKIKYRNTLLTAQLDFKPELNYPLMYITNIE